jgi:hypothetical protein
VPISIRIACGRGKRSANAANSAVGIEGSMGSVGAPCEMKMLGIVDMVLSDSKR